MKAIAPPPPAEKYSTVFPDPVPVCTWICSRACAHEPARKCKSKHTYARTHEYTWAHVRAQMNTRTRTHEHAHTMCAYTHLCTHTHMHAHTHSFVCYLRVISPCVLHVNAHSHTLTCRTPQIQGHSLAGTWRSTSTGQDTPADPSFAAAVFAGAWVVSAQRMEFGSFEQYETGARRSPTPMVRVGSARV